MTDPNPMNPLHARVPMKGTKAVSLGTMGGGGIGIVLVWAWGIFVPEHPMPPEVAIALSGFVGSLLGRFL